MPQPWQAIAQRFCSIPVYWEVAENEKSGVGGELMKKRINKSILFYVASVLFLIASAIGLTTGNENTMAIIWLSLGSAFLCLGSTYKKKENNKTNTDDK